MIKVVLADWCGYQAFRQKRFSWGDAEETGRKFSYQIECGIGPLLRGMSIFEGGVEFSVVVVMSLSDKAQLDRLRKVEKICGNYSFVHDFFVKDNENMDIGAYSLGYQYLIASQFSGDVVFLNSSARSPREVNWLLKYKNLFNSREDIGFCGVSMNDAIAPHVQSFFIYTSMSVLCRCFEGSGFTRVPLCTSKQQLIIDGEVWMSQCILNNGLALTSAMFPNFVYSIAQPSWMQPVGDLRYNQFYCENANQI
jgi:hypothetical protein